MLVRVAKTTTQFLKQFFNVSAEITSKTCFRKIMTISLYCSLDCLKAKRMEVLAGKDYSGGVLLSWPWDGSAIVYV